MAQRSGVAADGHACTHSLGGSFSITLMMRVDAVKPSRDVSNATACSTSAALSGSSG
jgi:hypothetical protein